MQQRLVQFCKKKFQSRNLPAAYESRFIEKCVPRVKEAISKRAANEKRPPEAGAKSPQSIVTVSPEGASASASMQERLVQFCKKKFQSRNLPAAYESRFIEKCVPRVKEAISKRAAREKLPPEADPKSPQ